MATTRGLIRDLLLPMLDSVNGSYKGFPEQWRQFFKEKSSTMAVERIAQMQYTSLLAMKSEGTAMKQDSGMKEKYLTQIEMVSYGLAFTMTHETIQDNQYKTEFPMGVQSLKDSSVCTQNTVGGITMINGFTNNMADGVPLFSAAHPYDGGTFSNLLNAGLNETAANQANILAQSFRTEAGLQMVTLLETLVVAPQGEFVAEKLTKSKYEPSNANNGLNPINSMGLFKNGYAVNNFINPTSADAPNWFITTNHPGLVFFRREKPQYSIDVDSIGTTKNVITSVFERYGMGPFDPRSCLGSPSV